MAICDSACAPSLPVSYNGGCGIVTRSSGISKFAFIKCDYSFTDFSDAAEWTTAITAGDIVGTGLLMAEKPKGDFEKRRVQSCAPEAVVGGTKTINFQDYNTDTVTGGGAGVLHYDFWNGILAQPSNFLFAWYTCNQFAYGPVDSFQIEIDEVEENSENGKVYFDGTITYDSVAMTAPTSVNLDGIL